VGFILLPIAFFIIGYLLLYFALTPIKGPAKSIYGLAFSNMNASTAEGSQGKDMYSGHLGVYDGTIKASEIHFPYVDDKWGELTIESIGIENMDLIYGDNTANLLRGACMSERSRLPGFGSGTLVAAHNYSFFHELQNIKEGAEVKVETYYGSYVYKVYKTEIIDVYATTDYWDDVYGENDTLALYTCYPNNALRSTHYRFFAFCELVSGPKIDEYN
jgi:sortase A